MTYAMGYGVGIDKDKAYEDLLAVGDVINAYGLPVIDRKIKANVIQIPFVGKFVHFFIKVKFEDGNKMKFKFTYPLTVQLKLVDVSDKKQQQEEIGDEEVAELQKQLEALGLGINVKNDTKQKAKIGFNLE